MQGLHDLLADKETRFSVALCIAVAAHALIILGVGFASLAALTRQPVYSLNIALEERSAGQQSEAAPGGAPGDMARTAPDTAQTEDLVPPLAALSAPGGAVLTLALARLSRPAVAPAEDTSSTDQQLVELRAASPAVAHNPRVITVRTEDTSTIEGYYAENWRLRVQDIATSNYPEEARRRGLTGRLTLDVAVRADGGIAGVRVLRSSGVPLLDEAALLIVQISAPFPPFPAELKRQCDILHIVRTWEFDQDERLIAHEAAGDL